MKVTNWTGVKSTSDKDVGFTYIAENLISGKRYVGSKVLYKPDGKSSNWKTYKTSSKYLKEDMSKLGEDNFRFRIISFHENIEEMYELEQFTQETLDVLRSRLPNGELEFYNKNIPSTLHLMSHSSSFVRVSGLGVKSIVDLLLKLLGGSQSRCSLITTFPLLYNPLVQKE